jgi:hypothetical protein
MIWLGLLWFACIIVVTLLVGPAPVPDNVIRFPIERRA